MNQKEVAALLAMNKANFPHAYQDMPKSAMTGLLDSWVELFAPYPKELIQQAFMEALKVCKFPVTPADIFARLKAVSALEDPSVSELWSEFLRAAEGAYILSTGFYYNAPSFKYEKLTQGQERRRDAQSLLDGLHPASRDFVGNLGRLISFGKMDEVTLEQVIFPSFRRAVEGYQSRKETLAYTSSTMLEAVGKNKARMDSLIGEACRLLGGEDHQDDLF